MVRCCPRHHPSTASRIFDDEAVIMSPRENRIRLLNPVGSQIWALIDGTRSAAQIAHALTDVYEVSPLEAQQQVAQFLDELTAKGLLIWEEPLRTDAQPGQAGAKEDL